MDYLKNSSTICFTICKPRWETENLKIPCTSIVIEGSLEEIKNRAYYGITVPPS
jgi:hypothetical protein